MSTGPEDGGERLMAQSSWLAMLFLHLAGRCLLPGRLDYSSPARLMGLPLVRINKGGGVRSGHAPNVAKGWLAVGDVAVGVISIGHMAFGAHVIGGAGADPVADPVAVEWFQEHLPQVIRALEGLTGVTIGTR
jgi:hypothetical protein